VPFTIGLAVVLWRTDAVAAWARDH
jgi:hypothetical protein